MQPEIIYETENFLAVNKPAGLLVHQARTADKKDDARQKEPTLVDWLLARYPELRAVGDDPEFRPGIVHRLDKETSGVILVPKNQDYFEYLKSLFQSHAIKKEYYAVVSGVPKDSEGIIEKPIGITNGTLKRSVRSKKMLKDAVTRYRVVRKFKNPEGESFSLLAVSPETGRTHQIRVHLASIGHPVVGDPLYGPKQRSGSRLMLHAAAIEFREKNGSVIRIESELPQEFS